MTRPPVMLGRRRPRNRRITQRAESGGVHLPVRELARYARVGALLALGVMLLAGVVVGGVAGWRALHATDRLRVRSVEITGNHRASVRELEAFSGVKLGDAVLDLDLDAMAAQLRRHPWVESATVRRRLPDKVRIVVQEYEPAILVSLGEVYLATAEGKLFKRLSPGDGVGLPVVTGFSRDDAARSTTDLEEGIRTAAQLAAAVARYGKSLGRLDELHFDADLGWSILVSPLGEDSVRFHLGDDPLPRVATAALALSRLQAKAQVPAVVWADSMKHPNRVQVRLHEAEPPGGGRTIIAKAR
jgi:cell division protein FtsQ